MSMHPTFLDNNLYISPNNSSVLKKKQRTSQHVVFLFKNLTMRHLQTPAFGSLSSYWFLYATVLHRLQLTSHNSQLRPSLSPPLLHRWEVKEHQGYSLCKSRSLNPLNSSFVWMSSWHVMAVGKSNVVNFVPLCWNPVRHIGNCGLRKSNAISSILVLKLLQTSL